jgi:hypothetical protein
MNVADCFIALESQHILEALPYYRRPEVAYMHRLRCIRAAVVNYDPLRLTRQSVSTPRILREPVYPRVDCGIFQDKINETGASGFHLREVDLLAQLSDDVASNFLWIAPGMSCGRHSAIALEVGHQPLC